MIKRMTLSLAALAVLAAFAPSSYAQSAKAVSIGISGGVAIPVSDLGNDFSTGYNGTVSLSLNSVGTPLGIRFDGMYNKVERPGRQDRITSRHHHHLGKREPGLRSSRNRDTPVPDRWRRRLRIQA